MLINDFGILINFNELVYLVKLLRTFTLTDATFICT